MGPESSDGFPLHHSSKNVRDYQGLYVSIFRLHIMKKKTDPESSRDLGERLSHGEMYPDKTEPKTPQDYERELLSHGESETNKQHIFDENRAFQRLDSRLRSEKLVPEHSRWKNVRYIGLAASVALIAASIWFFHLNQKNAAKSLPMANTLSKSTLRGQKLKAQLPDGSSVWLNAESRITFPDHFGATRKVTLEGEAFFDIEKDAEKPFIIEAGKAEIKVLGTSFNVKAYPEEKMVETVVVTGTVAIEGPKAQPPITLTPNQKAVYRYGENSFWKETVEIREAVSWRNGILTFTDADLPEVIKKLERWFDVEFDVITAAITNCKVTATFDNLALEQIMEQLQFIAPITYEIEEKTVTLWGKGC